MAQMNADKNLHNRGIGNRHRHYLDGAASVQTILLTYKRLLKPPRRQYRQEIHAVTGFLQLTHRVNWLTRPFSSPLLGVLAVQLLFMGLIICVNPRSSVDKCFFLA